MSSRSHAASTDLALRLSGSSELDRGAHMQLVLTHEWLERNKRGELTPTELRTKQACWDWFSQLAPGALEEVRVPSLRL